MGARPGAPGAVTIPNKAASLRSSVLRIVLAVLSVVLAALAAELVLRVAVKKTVLSSI